MNLYNFGIPLSVGNVFNVVPLVRTLEAKPAEIPIWIYDKSFIFDYNRVSCATNWRQRKIQWLITMTALKKWFSIQHINTTNEQHRKRLFTPTPALVRIMYIMLN